MTTTFRDQVRAPLDFADFRVTGRFVPIDQIDFMHLAKLAHEAIVRMGSGKLPTGVSKEQMAALAISDAHVGREPAGATH